VQLADLLRKSGRKREAIHLAEEGVAEDTNSIGYWRRLGKLLKELDRTILASFVNERVRLLESTKPGGSLLDLNSLLMDQYAHAFRPGDPNVASAAPIFKIEPEKRRPNIHTARHAPSSSDHQTPKHVETQTNAPRRPSANDFFDDESARIPLLW